MFRSLVVGLVAAVVVLPNAVLSANVGINYSPFHVSEYYTNPGAIVTLLDNDLQHIAAQGFSYIRTFHAQFYGHNVVPIAQKHGLQVALGVQMLGSNSDEYAFLETDIQAAVWAAQNAPANVLAIYVGNENLGASSADRIVEVISRIKSELRGTAGEAVPVGTVQRLHEWLYADPDAAKLALASDVVGANIYPFFTNGTQTTMKASLAEQWQLMTNKYGAKARLTETGWSSYSEMTPAGNKASVETAQEYFHAFLSWADESGAVTPFYFMMYDWPTAPGNDYERHFGLARFDGTLKFALNLANTNEPIVPTNDSTIDIPATDIPETLEPITEVPTVVPAPIDGSLSSGSGSGIDDIVIPTSLVPSSDGSDGSESEAGVLSKPTYAPATHAPTLAPAPAATTTKSPEQQVAEEAAAREATSRQARGISGGSGDGFYVFGMAAVVLGVAAIAVVAVYMKRQNADEGETRTVAASSAASMDPRASTPSSVYDDPLGTRFSSIVMITPNGDGVCIL